MLADVVSLLHQLQGSMHQSVQSWLMLYEAQHQLRLCTLPILRLGLLLQVRIAVVGEGTGKCIRAAGQPDLLSLEYTATVVCTVPAGLLGWPLLTHEFLNSLQSFVEICGLLALSSSAEALPSSLATLATARTFCRLMPSTSQQSCRTLRAAARQSCTLHPLKRQDGYR